MARRLLRNTLVVGSCLALARPLDDCAGDACVAQSDGVQMIQVATLSNRHETSQSSVRRTKHSPGGCAKAKGATQIDEDAENKVGSLVCRIGAPAFDVRQAMREHLDDFIQAYNERPGGENKGGVGFFHAGYLFVLIRTLKPKYVIESGAFKGIGTWFLRRACGDCQIIVVSPNHPTIYVDKQSNSKYFTGKHFEDFNRIDWDGVIPRKERANAFIFFDDHQSGLRRSKEARSLGFKHVAFDDNYIEGDNFSLKQACDVKGLNLKPQFRNNRFYRDNFNQFKKPYSTEGAEKYFAEMTEAVEVYYEMPQFWRLPSTTPARTAEVSERFRASELFTKRSLLNEQEAREKAKAVKGPFDMNEQQDLMRHLPYVRLRD